MHDITTYLNPAIPQVANIAALTAWVQGQSDYPVMFGQRFRLLDKHNQPIPVPNPSDPYDASDISKYITMGQVSHSNASDVHRSIQIELLDAELRADGVQLRALNSRLQAFLTYGDPRTIDPKTGKPVVLIAAAVFLGTLDIPDRAILTSGDILKITCLDLTQEIAKRGFPVPFAFPANSNLAADLAAFLMMDNRAPDDGGRQPSVTIRQILPPALAPTTTGSGGLTTSGPSSYTQAQSWTIAARTMPDIEVMLEDGAYALGSGVTTISGGSSGPGDSAFPLVLGGDGTPAESYTLPPATASYVDYSTDISGFSFPPGTWTASVSLEGTPYPFGATKLQCIIYELKADNTRTPLATLTSGAAVTLGTGHTSPETDVLTATGTLGAITAGQGSRLSAQFWLIVTSPIGAASGSGGTTGATVTESFVITETDLTTTTPAQVLVVTPDQTGTAGQGSGTGVVAAGFLVEDGRSGCYQTGETDGSGNPLYAHPGTVHAGNGSGGYVRYLAGQGLKIDSATGTVYNPAGPGYPGAFAILNPYGGRQVWLIGDGDTDWLECNPTTGTIWSGDPAAPTIEGTILGGDGATPTTTAADTTDPNGNNVVAVNAATGRPFWPDPNAPGLAPSGCPCPAANWPASGMSIATSDYVLPQALTFYTDSNQIAAAKSICALLNFEDPSADEWGRLVIRPLPYSTAATVTKEWLFDTSNVNIVTDVQQRIAGKDQLANMVVVVSKNHALAQPIVSIAKNTSLDSEISIPNLGETIFVKVIQDDRIMTQAEADARAYVEINAIALASDTVDVTLGMPFGFFRNNDLVGLNIVSRDGRLEIDASYYPYIVSAWTLDLFTFACTFTAARRVRL